MDSLVEILHRIEAKLESHDGQFENLSSRFDRLEIRVEENTAALQDVNTVLVEELSKIDARFEQIDIRLDRMDARFEKIDIRLDQMDVRFEKIDIRLDQIDERVDVKTGRIEFLLEHYRDDIKLFAEGITGQNRRLNDHESRIVKLEKSA